MASQSPPGSPHTSEFDPDTDDEQYFRDLTPPRQPPHEGFSLDDLRKENEQFGDVLVEGESDSSAPSPPPQTALAHRPAPAHIGDETPEAIDDEPAIVTASRDAKSVQTEADILESIRQIAVAPPPYAFPAASFTPTWPDLNRYTSDDGVPATDGTFWSFPEHLHRGKQAVVTKLHKLSMAGMSLRLRRSGSGEQTTEVYLVEVYDLLQAAINANEITALDFDLNPTEPYEPNNPLIKWLTMRVNLAIDHALAAIAAEGAYHNVKPLENVHTDWQSMLCIKDRLQGVLQRTVKWEKMSGAQSFTGDLLTTFISENVEQLQALLRREDGVSAYMPGHTISSLFNENTASIEENILLPLLPHVSVFRRDVDSHAVNHEASGKNDQLKTFTRVLAQQYAALHALLNTYLENDPNSPFHELPKIIQLDEHHSSPRSILVFKSAWLVLQMADKLWRDVEMHGKKGRLSRDWLQRQKAKLKGKLEYISEVAMSAQVDAAVEALRYWEAPTGQKYWGYDGEAGGDVHEAEDEGASGASGPATETGGAPSEPVEATGGRGGHAMEPVGGSRETGGDVTEESGDVMEMD